MSLSSQSFTITFLSKEFEIMSNCDIVKLFLLLRNKLIQRAIKLKQRFNMFHLKKKNFDGFRLYVHVFNLAGMIPPQNR